MGPSATCTEGLRFRRTGQYVTVHPYTLRRRIDVSLQSLKPILHALLIPQTLPYLSLAGNRRLKPPAYKLIGIFAVKVRDALATAKMPFLTLVIISQMLFNFLIFLAPRWRNGRWSTS